VTVFRRRNRKQDDDSVAEESEAVETTVEDEGAPVSVRATGPWDVDDTPDDGLERIDLGALRVPTLEGTELRLEADEAGQVTTVLLVSSDSALQLSVFAAPRSEGIWDEVRGEIRDGISAEGGNPREVEGAHGSELHAELATAEGAQLARFVGYDGPRWFLRGVFTGAAGSDQAAAATLDTALRGVVVVRGGDPMPVRDPLPLHLPREVLESQKEAEEQQARQAPTLPERGPEITETR
jgi:hypothetical protein